MRSQAEHRAQIAIADYLAVALPPDAWVTAIDHANAKDALTGAIRKARGAKAGIPDFVLCWRGMFIGLEVKSAAGRLSAAQVGVAHGIKRAGGIYHVVRSSADVEALLRALGMDLRATHLPLQGGAGAPPRRREHPLRPARRAAT